MKVIRGGAGQTEDIDLFPNLIKMVSLYLLQSEYKDFEDELIASYAVSAWNHDELTTVNEMQLAQVMSTVPQFLSDLPNKETVFENLVKAKNTLFPNTGLCVFSIDDNDDPNGEYEYKTNNRTTADMIVFYNDEANASNYGFDFSDLDDNYDEDFDELAEYEDEIIVEPDGEINRSAIVVKRKPAFHDWLKFVLPGKEAGPENIYLTNECIEEPDMIESLLPEIFEKIMFTEFECFIDDENDIPAITIENFHRYFYLSPHNMVYDLGTFGL